MQRNGPQVEQVPNLVFGILHVKEVIVVVLRIDPNVGRHHLVRGERGDDVLHYLLLAQSQFAGARAVHLQPQRRIIEVLRNVSIRHTADLPDLAGEI